MNASRDVHLVDRQVLKDFCAEAIEKQGVTPKDAEIVADTMVEADLRGVESHGVIRLAPYVRMISEGNMNPRPRLSLINETPVTAVMDADNGIGNVVCYKAANLAIQKAASSGVSVVGVKNGTHCGALAYYAMMALKHNMISLLTLNGPPLVPAYGGVTRLFSTNPYAAAIPAGNELPVVIDMATTVVAGGKIRLKANSGEKIPLGWALNRFGEPTEDAREALENGFYAWIGGHKGYALALLADILAGVLTGGSFNVATFPPYNNAEYGSQIVRQGCLIIVLKIENFVPIEYFKARMDELIRDIKASELARGFERIYLPGERAFEEKERRLKMGIPISLGLWDNLMAIKKRFNLQTDLNNLLN
jgi:LDH2 family malate/lactate/ureidoglycolate dehydrogenase